MYLDVRVGNSGNDISSVLTDMKEAKFGCKDIKKYVKYELFSGEEYVLLASQNDVKLKPNIVIGVYGPSKKKTMDLSKSLEDRLNIQTEVPSQKTVDLYSNILKLLKVLKKKYV